MLKAVATLTLVLAAGGCADQMLSDSRIRDNTAMTLFQPAGSISITDRHYDGLTNTSYIAHTPQGTYNCVINGGGALAMGITNPPLCAPLGTPIPPRRLGSTR